MIKQIIPILLLLIPTVSAADLLELNLDCEEDICVSGRVSDWNLTINYFGNTKIRVLGYRIIYADSQKEITSDELDFPVEIIQTVPYTFQTRKKIPDPNIDNYAIMNVCLTTVPDTDSWRKSGKTLAHCYSEFNFTVETIECLEKEDCRDDSLCTNNICVEIECGACQYGKNYVCFDHECCDNSMCNGKEFCDTNLCKPLICEPLEYIINYTCTSTACAIDEAVENFTCVPLDCADDYYYLNHECVPLNCELNQYVDNRTCVDLNCSFDEYYGNHVCEKLNCLDDEIAVNQVCEKLRCLFFFVAEGHECRINSKILISAFLLAIIFFLITIDTKKYLSVTKKKIIKDLLNKKKEISSQNKKWNKKN